MMARFHLAPLVLALVALLVPLVAPQLNKCTGPCRCLQLLPEDPEEGFGVLVNCTGVPADAGGAVPMPGATMLEAVLRGAEFARLSFARCGAERLLPVDLPVPLRSLDLSFNQLPSLLDRVLNDARAELRVLRLDSNRLHELNADALRSLRALRLLDVSRNELKELDLGALPPTLLKLRAAGNAIEELLAPPAGGTGLELQELDLSDNALTSLERTPLASLGQLKKLRVSGNPLTQLDGSVFAALPLLQALDVSSCGLQELHLEKHGALLQLRAANNSLSAEAAARVASALPALQLLHLGANDLDAFPVKETHLSLQVLNLSDNALASLPDFPPLLPSLEVLDLSHNALATLPPSLGAPSLPALRHLLLDANEPLAQLSLKGDLPLLRELSARDLPNLRALGSDDLAGLRGEAPASCAAKDSEEAPGLVLRLGRNPLLADVHEAALHGLPLCELDLSSCALTALPEKAVQWEALRVIDLQGNPLDCSCSMQWLVDRIVKPLYDSDRRQLLYELRCGTPATLRGRRLVHFYDWEKALCSPRQTLERLQAPEASSEEQHYSLSASKGMLISLCAVGVIFVGTVVAGLTMHHQAMQRRRRQNRRV